MHITACSSPNAHQNAHNRTAQKQKAPLRGLENAQLVWIGAPDRNRICTRANLHQIARNFPDVDRKLGAWNSANSRLWTQRWARLARAIHPPSLRCASLEVARCHPGTPMRTNQTAHACVTGSCDAAYEFPSTARAARQAARTWFETAPDIAPAQYRDQQFIAHCEGKPDSALERKIRRHAFRQAYAEAIGHIVVEEARFHALPA